MANKGRSKVRRYLYSGLWSVGRQLTLHSLHSIAFHQSESYRWHRIPPTNVRDQTQLTPIQIRTGCSGKDYANSRSGRRQVLANVLETRKTAGTAENPTRQQTTLCDIQINSKYYWQLYLYCTDTQPFKTWVNLNFDPSWSFKVKCDSAIGLLIYGFLLIFNSNICCNSAPYEIWLRNRSDHEFDISMPLGLRWPNG